MLFPNVNNPAEAYVEIVEQPAVNAFRFRYESERRPHGSIPGVNSTPKKKTFPKIRIIGPYRNGRVIVSCVTKDGYRAHPHRVVSKEQGADVNHGVSIVPLNPSSNEIEFKNLGIQCVTRKKIRDSLEKRRMIGVDPFRMGYDPNEILGEDLNSVRLCFQVYVRPPGDCSERNEIALKPVVSNPIYDRQSLPDLVICKLSSAVASLAGGTPLVILCQKVMKDDIKVRFFEEQNDRVVWDTFGKFQPKDVYDQTAIYLLTPPYYDQNVDHPIDISVQLIRPSTNEAGTPVCLELLPPSSMCNMVSEEEIKISLKRKRETIKITDILDHPNKAPCGCILGPIINPDCPIHNPQPGNSNQGPNLIDNEPGFEAMGDSPQDRSKLFYYNQNVSTGGAMSLPEKPTDAGNLVPPANHAVHSAASNVPQIPQPGNSKQGPNLIDIEPVFEAMGNSPQDRSKLFYYDQNIRTEGAMSLPEKPTDAGNLVPPAYHAERSAASNVPQIPQPENSNRGLNLIDNEPGFEAMGNSHRERSKLFYYDQNISTEGAMSLPEKPTDARNLVPPAYHAVRCAASKVPQIPQPGNFNQGPNGPQDRSELFYYGQNISTEGALSLPEKPMDARNLVFPTYHAVHSAAPNVPQILQPGNSNQGPNLINIESGFEAIENSPQGRSNLFYYDQNISTEGAMSLPEKPRDAGNLVFPAYHAGHSAASNFPQIPLIPNAFNNPTQCAYQYRPAVVPSYQPLPSPHRPQCMYQYPFQRNTTPFVPDVPAVPFNNQGHWQVHPQPTLQPMIVQSSQQQPQPSNNYDYNWRDQIDTNHNSLNFGINDGVNQFSDSLTKGLNLDERLEEFNKYDMSPNNDGYDMNEPGIYEDNAYAVQGILNVSQNQELQNQHDSLTNEWTWDSKLN